MSNTEFIQIEAGLLKVNALQMSSQCTSNAYKCQVNNHYGKQPPKLLLGKIWYLVLHAYV